MCKDINEVSKAWLGFWLPAAHCPAMSGFRQQAVGVPLGLL